MKFLDRFKKKDKEQMKNAVGHQDGAAEKRRFTFVVDDTFQLLNNCGIVVAGKVHGKVREGDEVYIFKPDGTVMRAQVNGMEIGPRMKASVAENQNVALLLADIKDKREIAKFSVLTNISPQTEVDVNTAVENPYLLGLSMDYSQYYQDDEYFKLLIHESCHAHFIVPMYLDKEPEKNENGTATFHEGAHMQFRFVAHPEDKTKLVFPVFTDWSALGMWKDVFDKEHPPRTLICRFQDAVAFTKDTRGGIVINPYGPVSVYLPMDLIERITAGASGIK